MKAIVTYNIENLQKDTIPAKLRTKSEMSRAAFIITDGGWGCHVWVAHVCIVPAHV